MNGNCLPNKTKKKLAIISIFLFIIILLINEVTDIKTGFPKYYIHTHVFNQHAKGIWKKIANLRLFEIIIWSERHLEIFQNVKGA